MNKMKKINKRFFAISIVILLIMILTEYVAYQAFNSAGTIRSKQVEEILMILGVVFPIMFISSMLYSYRNYSKFNSWLNIVSSVWLAFISYIFAISILVSVLISTNSYLNLNIPIRTICNTLIILVLISIVYGLWNSNKIKIRRWNIKSDSLSKNWSGKKIVIVSDIHLGNIRHDKFMQEIVDTIKSENPDIIFNLGDLIDGPSIPYGEWFKPLLSLKPELGNFYVEGNHEKYSHEYEFFRSQFPASLNDLTDKKIIINNTQIIGLHHEEKEEENKTVLRLKSLDYDPKISSIILIHNPKNVKTLAENGVSLVLSGHTHDGQVFPGTTMVNMLYGKYSYGVSYTNNTISITSSGVGTSIIPIRIGTRPEIIVLTIE